MNEVINMTNTGDTQLGKTLITGAILGLASAGAIMTIANMQERTITNSGIILGGLIGPAVVIGIHKFVGD